MDLLRWILLIAGIIIILLIYLISRGKSGQRKWKDEEGLVEDDFSGVAGIGDISDTLAEEELQELGRGIRLQDDSSEPKTTIDKDMHRHTRAERMPKSTEQPAVKLPEKIIVIYLVGTTGEKFTGTRVYDALQKAGLEFGEMNIFHRYPLDAGESREAIFSVANLVEPGSFDLDTLEQMETPGLTLFISLRGQPDALQSFDLFMETARLLKQELAAELRDQTRNVLNRQAMTHMRDEVLEYCHQLRLARAGR